MLIFYTIFLLSKEPPAPCSCKQAFPQMFLLERHCVCARVVYTAFLTFIQTWARLWHICPIMFFMSCKEPLAPRWCKQAVPLEYSQKKIAVVQGKMLSVHVVERCVFFLPLHHVHHVLQSKKPRAPGGCKQVVPHMLLSGKVFHVYSCGL